MNEPQLPDYFDLSAYQSDEPPSPIPPNQDAPPPKLAGTGRLTVVESVYCEVPGTKPTQEDSRYARGLAFVDDPPYTRPMWRVGPDWQPLDAGWLSGVPLSLVLLTNLEGTLPPEKLPTYEEREAVIRRVVEVGVVVGACDNSRDDKVEGFAEIQPGESIRFRPLGDSSRVRVRCREPLAHCRLTLIPD